MKTENKNSSINTNEDCKLILERISDAFISLDNNFCYTYINSKAGKLVNKEPQYLLGKNIWEEFPESVNQPFYIHCKKAFKEQIQISSKEYYPDLDFWVDYSIYPSAEGLSIFLKDITKEQKSENKIQYLNLKMDAAIRIGEIGFWEWDIKKDEIFWSDKVYEIYDVPKGTPLKYDTVISRLHPEDITFHDKIVEEKIRTKDNSAFEYRVQQLNGTIRYVRVQMEVLSNEQGESITFRGTVMDITEKKLAEILLLNENETLEMLAKGTSMPHVLNNVSLNFEKIYPNANCSILLYNESNNSLQHGAAPSLPIDYVNATNGAIVGPNVGSCGTAAFTKKQVIVSDIENDPLWKEYKNIAQQYNLKACWSTPIISSSNTVLGTFAVYYSKVNTPSDNELQYINKAVNLVKIVLENFRKEADIIESEETFRRLFYESGDATLLLQDRKFIDCNTAALKMLGYSCLEEIFNKKPWEISPINQPNGQSSIEKANQNIEAALKNGYYKFDWVHTKLDGTEFPVEVMLTSIVLRGKQSFFTVWRDITEKKLAEKEIQQNQEKILKLNQELEQKVKERTEQLQQTIKDLEEVNDLFVDREMRIIELKEEINKLRNLK